MYGDALMEFLVFPRALCSSQGPVYLGRYRKQLTYNNIVSLALYSSHAGTSIYRKQHLYLTRSSIVVSNIELKLSIRE